MATRNRRTNEKQIIIELYLHKVRIFSGVVWNLVQKNTEKRDVMIKIQSKSNEFLKMMCIWSFKARINFLGFLFFDLWIQTFKYRMGEGRKWIKISVDKETARDTLKRVLVVE